MTAEFAYRLGCLVNSRYVYVLPKQFLGLFASSDSKNRQAAILHSAPSEVYLPRSRSLADSLVFVLDLIIAFCAAVLKTGGLL